jgi:hypothetical protein
LTPSHSNIKVKQSIGVIISTSQSEWCKGKVDESGSSCKIRAFVGSALKFSDHDSAIIFNVYFYRLLGSISKLEVGV